MNGLINSDRTFHPAMEEIKKVYQNILFSLENNKYSINLKIKNQYFFTNLKDFRFKYELLKNGNVIENGNFNIDLKPQDSKSIEISLTEYLFSDTNRDRKSVV